MKQLTLHADLAARQGKFARSARTERTTSELIPLSTCIHDITNVLQSRNMQVAQQKHTSE